MERSDVAVVEDDPASQKTLARVLRAGGYEAALYASAEEFLSSPLPESPIGLLLDVHLSGMSGLDLQRRLRNEGSTIPVIIITAFDDARSREQAERVGCVAYLRQPCEAETILALLRSLAHDEPSSNCSIGLENRRSWKRSNGSSFRLVIYCAEEIGRSSTWSVAVRY
jgi:FixJ family two-component response regulator